MDTIKPRSLVMVTASANNNKYYRQIPHGSSWTAEYGRVGNPPQKAEYPMSSWDKKYQEKINKGYIDQSELVEELIEKQPDPTQTQYLPITNQSIAEIVQRLQNMARKAISDNYTISANKVTQAMIDEAQRVLVSLLTIDNLDEFNKTLLYLFTVIPRKMSNVKMYLADNMTDIAKIIQTEQDLLDVMKGQVVQKQQTVVSETSPSGEDKPNPQNTLLDSLGLVFEECDSNDIERIKQLLQDNSRRFVRAWKVRNLKTQTAYDNYIQKENITNEKLLWHGSRNENWWSIINNGLVLNPTNAVITGKMFGFGIYYAPKAQKSIGYTSLDGSYWAKGGSASAFMAVMNVAYGKPFDVYSFESRFHQFNYEELQRSSLGAHCLHAHAGSMLHNDEIVVYNQSQSTIKYLVEIK